MALSQLFLRHVATNSSNSAIFFKFKMASIFLDIVHFFFHFQHVMCSLCSIGLWDRQMLVSSFCLCFCPQLCYSLLTMTPMKRVNTNSWCSPCWLHMTWLTWKELWVPEHTIFLFFLGGGTLLLENLKGLNFLHYLSALSFVLFICVSGICVFQKSIFSWTLE